MIVIASRDDYPSSHNIFKALFVLYPHIVFVGNPIELEKMLPKVLPEQIFFVFWSWKVPTDILEYFKCVSFHASDLPKFMGGSPIQNQIVRGMKETKITAFKTSQEMDKGDIYLKRDLSLEGDLSDIFKRMEDIIPSMIMEIITDKPKPIKQEGKATYYPRRHIIDCEIKPGMTAEEAYDIVRSVNMEPYPPAYIKFNDGSILNIYKAKKGGRP